MVLDDPVLLLLVVTGHAVCLWSELMILFDELLEFTSLDEFLNFLFQFMIFVSGMTITFVESTVLPRIFAHWPLA